jgi:tetratricopeptide (TPR) repeat protein
VNTWVETADFQQVMQLSHTWDLTALNRHLEARLAATQGRERAFWLLVRANRRAMDVQVSHVLDAAWADLEEALRIAPDDPSNRADTLAAALNICLTTERSELFLPTLKGLRHCYYLVDPVGVFWQYVGIMHMKRRRWHQAARALERAIVEFTELEPVRKELYECRLSHCYAWRAIGLVACGRIEESVASIELGQALARRQPPQGLNHLLFATAQAEVALHEGRPQVARSALQHGLVLDSDANRPKQPPSQLAEIDLLAARIARAEGNQVGFTHFCNKALAICDQYKLPLTAARVRAVLAGANM